MLVLLAIKLVALNKYTGVRQVGISNIWRQEFVKYVMVVCKKEATESCGADQLCGGLV